MEYIRIIGRKTGVGTLHITPEVAAVVIAAVVLVVIIGVNIMRRD